MFDANPSAVREAMRREGALEMALAFDTQGAQAIVNDSLFDGDERGRSRWIFVPKATDRTHRRLAANALGRSMP